MRILSGDVGGTKTNLVLAEAHDDRLEVLDRRTVRSAEYPGLIEALAEFQPDPGPIQAAAFGVAGAVIEGRSRLTNLDWVLDEGALGKHLGAPVRLMNDLEANAHGIGELAEESVLELQGPPGPPDGPAALISAGTGLGQAILPWVDGRSRPMPTEAGHTDFAPRNAVERRLHAFLEKRFGRATWENVLSGPGLGNLYDFECQEAGADVHADVAAARTGPRDPNAEVARLAQEGQAQAGAALARFVELYGSEAGNLALRTLAHGGVYVGGGIAPRILEALRGGRFLEAFRDKPPFRELDCALWGAARVAAELAG
jgi:glucokinase